MKKELLTPEDIRLLSHNPLLRGFSENDCKKLLTALRAAVRSYPKNTEILSAGSPATQIGIVLEGSAQVISSDVFGNQTIFAPSLMAVSTATAFSPPTWGLRTIPPNTSIPGTASLAMEARSIVVTRCDLITIARAPTLLASAAN